MPIYEYECDQCRHEFELLIRGQEQAACPKCGTVRVHKLLSVTATPVSQNAVTSSLPMAPGDCGRPQCASGGCQGWG
jgi:putative FmdB family regulatory protein